MSNNRMVNIPLEGEILNDIVGFIRQWKHPNTITKTSGPSGSSCTTHTTSKHAGCASCGAGEPEHRMAQVGHEAEAQVERAAAEMTTGADGLGHKIKEVDHNIGAKVEEFGANR